MRRTLGTCYYPEHWLPEVWEDDARRMANAGLTWVRIGEFSWHKLEPEPGQYDWEWLGKAIAILGDAGLRVVLGTPTATPPRWMLDRHPDMLAVDAHGRPRNFGSRRHYCFSHEGYKNECARIVEAMARRYGQNPHVAAWQIDNEYGCHGTTISYSDAARSAFQNWLRRRYPGVGNDGDIQALNTAWGNAFWSMSYDRFDQIDFPNQTVTEPSPAHAVAFRRFSSDQVVAFNQLQAKIVRTYSTAPIAHNFMGRITDFDHFAVGADLDIASWDSYPLGFLEDRVGADSGHQRRFARQGDPDFQAFHHDLYRAVGRGRWWIMEQQPGPVNWAPYNPAPLPGMVRLWTWEAFAHGAEAVCYFRWRQVPFAQEQMHAGLLRPDGVDTPAMKEVLTVSAELKDASQSTTEISQVALIFDYDADFAWAVQPHGQDLSYFKLVFDTYKVLRRLGLSIDILPPDTRDFNRYKLILAPGLMLMDEALKTALALSNAQVLIGPRSGARDSEMSIPVPLPPQIPGMDVKVSYVESLRPDMPVELSNGGNVIHYREVLEGTGEVVETTLCGAPIVMATANQTYIGGWLDPVAMVRVVERACTTAGIETLNLPEGLRVRETETERFWFNYTAQPITVGDLIVGAADLVRQPRNCTQNQDER